MVKVISDGSRNIVIGFEYTGPAGSLGLNSDSLRSWYPVTAISELPESLEITADVEELLSGFYLHRCMTMFSTPSIPTTSPDTMT